MSFTHDQLTAITFDLIVKKMSDGVFTGDMFLNRFWQKKEIFDGGLTIRCPLFSADENDSIGGYYSPRDALSLNEVDVMTDSIHNLKYLYESIVLYQADIAKNSGKAGQLSLVKNRVMHGEASMREKIKRGIFSDGTSATGMLSANQLTGLQAIVAASGTYASIAPADLASWVSTVDDNSGTGRALTQTLVDGSFDATVEGEKGGATLGVFNKSVQTKFKGLLTGFQRTTRDSSVSGLGHKGTSLVYNGIDYMVENNTENTSGGDGKIYHLDERHLKLYVHKDNNMRVQKIDALETKDAMLHRIFLYAEIVGDQRKYHSLLTDLNI